MLTATLAFQEALHQVIAHAQEKLPVTLHERLARAAALVEAGEVFMDEDGVHAQVRSSDGATWYTPNASCQCKDFQYQAPEGWCAHRLAVALYRRATELMSQSAVAPTDTSPSTFRSPPCPPTRLRASWRLSVAIL